MKKMLKNQNLKRKMNEYNQIALNTARNALRYIIKAFDIKEIYIPYYICPALRNAVFKEKINLHFYNININFEPIVEFPQNAYILYPNYFGVCTSIAEKMAIKYKNLIVDNAHSFFAEPKGIASFNSARKFFPSLQDGAFLYTTKIIDVDLPKDNYSYTYNELTFEELTKNENRLDNEDIKQMSDCTLKYLSNLNLKQEKERLISHFQKYQTLYDKQNKLNYKITPADIPFKYPFLAENIEIADKLANELEKEHINIYRYWNNLPDSFIEKAFYTRLIVI